MNSQHWVLPSWMPTTIGQSARPRPDDWIALWLDMLGQGDAFQSFERRTLSDLNPGEAKVLARSATAAKQIRDRFDGFQSLVRGFETRIPPGATDGMSPAEIGWFNAFVHSLATEKVAIQPMSDAILVGVPIRTPAGHLNFRPIGHLLAQAGVAALTCLAQGIPVRGGIATGIGFQLGDNDLFGPIVKTAFETEQKAGPPRVVVDEALTELLRIERQRLSENPQTSVLVEGVDACNELLFRDTDGKLCLDYAGPGSRNEFQVELLKHAQPVVESMLNDQTLTSDRQARWLGVDRYLKFAISRTTVSSEPWSMPAM